MKFVIRRTSNWTKKSPLRGAIREEVLSVDRRTFKSIKEHDRRFPDDLWLNRGMNHRKVDGCIARDFIQKEWTFEVHTLDQLIALSAAEGELIICKEHHSIKDLPMIEIYDDYRE